MIFCWIISRAFRAGNKRKWAYGTLSGNHLSVLVWPKELAEELVLCLKLENSSWSCWWHHRQRPGHLEECLELSQVTLYLTGAPEVIAGVAGVLGQNQHVPMSPFSVSHHWRKVGLWDSSGKQSICHVHLESLGIISSNRATTQVPTEVYSDVGNWGAGLIFQQPFHQLERSMTLWLLWSIFLAFYNQVFTICLAWCLILWGERDGWDSPWLWGAHHLVRETSALMTKCVTLLSRGTRGVSQCCWPFELTIWVASRRSPRRQLREAEGSTPNQSLG